MNYQSHSRAPLRALCLTLGLLLAAGYAAAATRAKAGPAGAADADASVLDVVPVRDNIYMLVSKAAANVTLQFGPDGVLLVDSATPELADAIYAEIRRHSDQPIRIIINTDAHAENVGGNERLARKLGGDAADRPAVGLGSIAGALIYAHENVLRDVSQSVKGKAAMPSDAWPDETYFGAETELYFNGEAVKLFYEPAAHTDGDSIVYFRRSDVISTGDIYNTEAYPIIDVAHGGSIGGIIDGLNHVIQIAVPAAQQENGTLIIPGRGRLCDEADIVEYRDMLTIIRDRVRHWKEQGKTLAQIQAARPTSDYDGRYGSTAGSWTTADFVTAIFNTVVGDNSSQRPASKSDVVR